MNNKTSLLQLARVLFSLFVLSICWSMTAQAQPTNFPEGDSLIMVPAEYRGINPHRSFTGVQSMMDAWVYGDVAFYAPQGEVSHEIAQKWVSTFVLADNLYQQMSTMDNFESHYRRNDANFGRKKVLAFTPTCGVGCGNKLAAEADPGVLAKALLEPENWDHLWVLYYEMARGGPGEGFYKRATWPNNTVILPHLMAGVILHELGGGIRGMGRGTTGIILGHLARWERSGLKWTENFAAAGERQAGGYISHELLAAMLLRILADTNTDTLEQILQNMTAKPVAEEAEQAMCDFQSAINDATDSAFAGIMVHRWGMPADCGWTVPEASPTTPLIPLPGIDAAQAIDLADIAAGGNGSLPGTSTSDSIYELASPFISIDNPLIDSAFIPQNTEATTISTTGLTADLTALNAHESHRVRAINKDVDSALEYTGSFFSSLQMPDFSDTAQHSFLDYHAAQGITFDLQQIRASTGQQIDRFTSTVISSTDADTTYAILVDGVPVVSDTLIAVSAQFIDIPLASDARFLSLVSGDNNENTLSNKHMFYVNPFLQKLEDADNDTIPDHIEKGGATNPIDTDNDGTPDYLDTDSDADGIDDIDEVAGADGDPTTLSDNTDPADADTDNDGLSDSVELGLISTGIAADANADSFTSASDASLHDANGGQGWAGNWTVTQGNTIGTHVTNSLQHQQPSFNTRDDGNAFCITHTDEASGEFLAERMLATPYTSGEVWFSFKVTAGNAGTGHFFIKTSSAGDSSIGKAWGGQLSIHNDRSTINFAPNQTYMLVARYNLDENGDDQVHLWINPPANVEPTLATADASIAATHIPSIDRVSINIQPHGLGAYCLDEIRIQRAPLITTRLITDPLDADSDDDGLSDSAEIAGADGDPTTIHDNTNPLNADSDNDGLQDGTELGITTAIPSGNSDGTQPVAFSGTDPSLHIPDGDPGKLSDPNNPDTDGDGFCDGNPADANPSCTDSEDTNNNGAFESGETDPTTTTLPPLLLRVNAMLHGAFDPETGLMHDKLRLQSYVPTTPPFQSYGLQYNSDDTITPLLLTVEGDDAIVDWVLLQLHDPTDFSQIHATHALLLQRDGNVVDAINGDSLLRLNGLAAGDYHISLHHRNHIDVMTAQPVTLDINSPVLVNFNDPATLLNGENARLIQGNIAFMWAGDADLSQTIIASGPGVDTNTILTQLFIAEDNATMSSNFRLQGYYNGDLNLDGLVLYAGPSNDVNLIMGSVLSHPGNVAQAANFIIFGAGR